MYSPLHAWPVCKCPPLHDSRLCDVHLCMSTGALCRRQHIGAEELAQLEQPELAEAATHLRSPCLLGDATS
jgi:hypothetical protein